MEDETPASAESAVAAVWRDLLACFRPLALTDLMFKLLALAAFTPLVGLLFRTLLAVSGRAVLADEDILYFLLGPFGWICFVVVGSLSVGVAALEQAALLSVVAARRQQLAMPPTAALGFAAVNAWRVVRVAARMLSRTLAVSLPFVVVAGLVYRSLLSDFDINFYLSAKPPALWTALAAGAVIALLWGAVLLRLFAGWCLALPLVLFEDVPDSQALVQSSLRTQGRRATLVRWIGGWFFLSTALSAAGTAGVGVLSYALTPWAAGSLWLLVLVAGATLSVAAVVNLIGNLLSAMLLSVILLNVYERLGGRIHWQAEPTNRGGSKSGAGFPWSYRRVLGVLVVGVVAAVSVGAWVLTGIEIDDHAQITAHRGASADAPENTLAAVKLAIEEGADWVEIDVQETADDEVVVFHDSDFMKLAGNPLKIWDATMSDLADIDVGSSYAPEFRDERVPRLSDVLQVCRGRIGVNIELKYYGHDRRLEQRVVQLVEAAGVEGEVVFMSLKMDAVQKLKSLRPTWTVGLLTSVAASDLSRLQVDFLAVNAGLADRRFVRAAHARGKKVHVWTVNDAINMSNLIGRGVDNVITDKPALGKSVLTQRAALSVPERLLLGLADMLGATPAFAPQ